MNCWKCGNELADGQRFCGNCGADQNARPQYGPDAPYEAPRAPEPPKTDWSAPNQPGPSPSGWNQPPQPSAAPKGDMSILFKIFGFVIAVCYGIPALLNLFDLVRTVFFRVVGYYGGSWAYILGTVVGNLVSIALSLFVCAVGVMIALRRKPENADGLFILLSGGLLARVLVTLLANLLIIVLSGGYYFNLGGVALMLVLSLVAAGALFGITAIAGEPLPLLNKNAEQLKASVSCALASARKSVSDIGSKTKSNPAAQQPQFNPSQQFNQTPQFNQGQQPNQNPQNGPVYGGGGYGRLQTDRSLLIYILLGIVTCGIYSYYFIYKLASDVNTACEGDGNHTSGLLTYILLSIVTCGIYSIIWEYNLANRLSANAPRYGMSFQENGTTVLMWLLFGWLICGIGPFIAMYIIIKNTNRICMAYNQYNNL